MMNVTKECNKFFKRVLTFMLSMIVMLTCMTFPASAANVLEWNGKDVLQPGKTYYISDIIKINKEVIIPETTTLRLRDGGELYIYKKGSLVINGTLYIAGMSFFKNSGNLTLAETGVVKNYGEFLSSISANVKLKGEFKNFKQGSVHISSTVLLYKSSLFNNRGELYLLNSSDSTISGTINNESSGDFHLQGKSAITVSGSLNNDGYFVIGSIGSLKVSGKVLINRKSDYNRFGDVTVTKSGSFQDMRTPFKFEDMTVATLVDEEDVLLKGIDVSYAQGDINWTKVANSGIDFAIIRAARGTAGTRPMKTDDYFVKNITEATANGIDCGVYFYSYASTVAEAVREAEYLVDVISDYEITFPVVLDMEEEMGSDVPITEMIDAFFNVLMENGYFPMFYSYKYWIESYLDMRILDKYAIWLAEIANEPTYEGGYYIWQYSYKGKVSGINTDVDLNYAYRNFPDILRRKGLNNLIPTSD